MKKQLFLYAALAFSLGLVAQPTVVGTSLIDGSYATHDLAARGAVRSVRLEATSTGGSRNWEFTTGSAGSPNYSTNWRPYISSQTLSSFDQKIDPSSAAASARYNTGFGGQSGLLPTITSGRFYTIIIGQNSSSNNFMSVLETEFEPVELSSVSHVVGGIGASTTVNITTGSAPDADEELFVRYSTDGFTTSSFVQATGSGTSWSAAIPNQTIGVTVNYYVLSSENGITLSHDDVDYQTLELNNNSGSNYSFQQTQVANLAATGDCSGVWSDTDCWSNSTLPTSSDDIMIRHNITLDSDATISSLTISSNTFSASDLNPRTLTITRSDAGSATTLTNTGGTWANGSGGSTVVFSGSPGSGDAIHQTSGTLGLQNVTIEKSGGSDNVGVDFQANSSVSGTLEIGTGGYVSTSPPSGFYGGSATLAFNQGAGAEYDVGSGDNSWSTTEVPSNITISTGTVNLNDDRDATGALNISSGATLNVAAGKTLTLGASSTNGGDLFLKANSSGYAQLDLSDNTTLSNVTAEQYFDVSSGGRWLYMSTPVTTTTTNLLDPAFSIINYSGHSSPSIYRYDGSNYSAISSGTTLNKGDGFMIYAGTNPAGPYVFSAGTFTLSTSKGEITNQDVAISCTNSGTGSSTSGYNGASDGWNLVGNPFPQGLTAASIANANTTNFDGTIYGFDGSNFVSESSGGVGSFDVARPFQSFWVRRTSSGTSDYTLGYTNASTDAASFTKTNTQIPLITFSTTWQTGYVADNFVGFSSTATDAFDNQEDAFFLNAQTQGYANLFSFSSADEGLQIDMRSEQFQSKSIEMGFDSETNGTYSIVFAMEYIPSSWTLQLEDRVTNYLHDLNAGAYDFQHNSGNVLKRFVLHINKNSVGQEEEEMENFYWFQKDHLLTVDGLSLQTPTAVLLTDMMGRQVAFRNLSAGTQRVELNVSGLNNGVYLLQLGNRTAKIVLH